MRSAGVVVPSGSSKRAVTGDPRVGLCADCRHHRVTGNRRGSRFWLCERSRDDPRFRRYPALPVLSCPGYEPGDPDPWNEHGEQGGPTG